MRSALSLARRGLGHVAPNPAVGCILVRPDLGDRVVGRGWTQPGGRPHAETEALRRAGNLATGATAYVTLEPCSHTGKTPPCADALIAAGINRAVIAIEDPDTRVSGQGIAKLKAAGIDVSVGLMAAVAEEVNSGFLTAARAHRPLFTLKTATSADSKIATKTGHSKWITGVHARRFGHLLRAQHDAILVGIDTAIADTPALTCRIPGLADSSPVRIVVDSKLRIPVSHPLVVSADEVPTWICTTQQAEPGKIDALVAAGVNILQIAEDPKKNVDLNQLSQRLATEGLTRVLIEGGARLATSFIRQDLVDHIYWFRASKIVGGDGLNSILELGNADIEDKSTFTRRVTYDMGPDILDLLDRNRSPL